MINFIFSIIYLLVLIGIAIIDKKEHKISKKILVVGFIVEAIQIIYLYINNKYHLIEYLIYLVIFVILLIIDTIIIRKKGESLLIGDDIEITLEKIDISSVKISIKAPKEKVILRKEVYEKVKNENSNAIVTSEDILNILK